MTQEEIIDIWNQYKNEFDWEKLNDELFGMFQQIDSEFLYALVRHIKPKKIIEFSPHKGFTTTIMMQAATRNNTETSIYSYDLIEDSNNLDCKGLLSRKLIVGDVTERLNPKEVNDCDFLFIDSDHSYNFGKWYAQALLPRLKPGTIICIHDWPGYENPYRPRNLYRPHKKGSNYEPRAVQKLFIRPGLGAPVINITDYCHELGLQKIDEEAVSAIQVLIRTDNGI